MPKSGTGKPKKTNKRSRDDEDYQPPTPVERRFPTNASTNENASFLDRHADLIIDMMANRTRNDKKTGPAYIAKTICKKEGIRDSALHGRQVKNWYDYRVRTGQIPANKRKKVNHKNNNILAEANDCMLERIFDAYY